MKHAGKWQVGLEINAKKLTVVACQFQRQRCVLRFVKSFRMQTTWSWQSPTISQDECLPLLKDLRKHLPNNYSLRTCLPPDLILSHELRLPNTVLNKMLLYNYIQAAIIQLFPDTAQALMADYCVIEADNPSVQLTLVRKETIAQISQLFALADLQLDVIDLMPCALIPLFKMAELGNNCILLYQTALFWCWAYHDGKRVNSGWAHRGKYENPTTCLQVLSGENNLQPWLVSEEQAEAPFNFSFFNPFDFLCKTSTLELPKEPYANFCLASGLAMREEDSLCNR